MGKIFRTPSDDSVEQALRAMHTQKMVDTTYEKAMGWIKVCLFSACTAFVVSFYEYYTDWNLWHATGEWLRAKVTNWLF